MLAIPFTEVRFADRFWLPRQQTNHAVTLPHQYQMLRQTGRLDAFRLGWKPGMDNPPHIFWGSDVNKWLEAAAYSYRMFGGAALRRRLDEVVALIAGAQQPDGYLNIHFTVVEPEKRWTNLRDCHELYGAGHLIEGAVAHFQATGARQALNTACRYADYIARVFGRAPGQQRGYCGHEEIELALVKLHQATGESRYLDLARYFIDERGRRPHYFDLEAKARGEDPRMYWAKNYEYCQAHLPVREQRTVVGHAVRAFYLYSGMADVAARTGDPALRRACRRLWADAVRSKLYLTGGLGPSRHNEGFTAGYDLPNQSAYAETCASIAFVFFAQRMLQLEADSGYADEMERALYNGVLSGVSLDGRKFFYENPLASAGAHHRQEWFGCACCPPNLARLLASLGGYVYSRTARAVYVQLYAAGRGTIPVASRQLTLTQDTAYPWSGEITFIIGLDRPATFDLMLRIPGWCRGHRLRVNGRRVTAPMRKGYAQLRRTWRAGDVVSLSLAMPIERIAAHPQVTEDVGKMALQRGPLVYCLEQCDHTVPVRSLVLPARARLTARHEATLLGGVTVIEGTGLAASPVGWDHALYRRANEVTVKPVRFRAIPYYAWDNRQAGPMTVWLPSHR